MTTQEFNEKLEKATTVEEIAKLRNESKGCTHFISECKKKIDHVAPSKGFFKKEVYISVLKNLTMDTDCGQFFSFEVPAKNRIFAGCKKVYGYVNEKIGTKFQKVIIFFKECN